MSKEFYDKYSKELKCSECVGLNECLNNSNIPLCNTGYIRFAKDKISDLETKLAESQNDYLLLEEQLENANDWSKDFQQENKKLKKQLAESEKSKEINIKERDKICLEMATEYNREIIQLKQQLADSEYSVSLLAETRVAMCDTIKDLETKLAEYEKFMKDNEWNSIEEMQETLNKCEEKYFNLQLQLISREEQCRECKHLNKKIELNIKNKKSDITLS